MGCSIVRRVKRSSWHKKFIIGIVTCLICVAMVTNLSSSKVRVSDEVAKSVDNISKRKFPENIETTQEAAHDSLYNRVGSVVFLAGYYRSGSTFLGQLFNQNPDAFYLFEPLLPFAYSCDEIFQRRYEAIKRMSRCDFRSMPSAYKHAQNITKHNDEYARCAVDNLCFRENHRPFLQRYTDLCMSVHDNFNECAQERDLLDADKIINAPRKQIFWRDAPEYCDAPYNVTLESAICHSSKIVAFKLLRFCDLGSLMQLVEEISMSGVDARVVHLVRDPRAMLSSGMKLEIKSQQATKYSEKLCSNFRDNLKVEDRQNGSENKNAKYLRVRFEDLTMNPIREAERIYKFIGHPIHRDVTEWLKETSISPHMILAKYKQMLSDSSLGEKERRTLKQKVAEYQRQLESPFGTVREPVEVLRKWRLRTPYWLVQAVQKQCSDVLQKLLYKFITSEEMLRNTSYTAFHNHCSFPLPTTFQTS